MCVLEPICSDANTGSHFPTHEIKKQEFVFWPFTWFQLVTKHPGYCDVRLKFSNWISQQSLAKLGDAKDFNTLPAFFFVVEYEPED